MRQSRLRKFKTKYRWFWFTTKIVLIWYALIFSTTYLTSNTAAVFTNSEESSGKIEAGFWEPEEFVLEFTTKGNQNIDACKSIEIKTIVKNNGPGDMNENGSFEVYYIAKGNPTKGAKDGVGTFESIESGKSTELTYKASKPGRYAFLIYQQSDSNLKLWSKEIRIDCGSGQEPNKSDQEVKEDESIVTDEQQGENTDTLNEAVENTEAHENAKEDLETKEEVVENNENNTETSEEEIENETNTEKEEEEIEELEGIEDETITEEGGGN
ncbi:amyloid fiber anchoring/assembly protein TapA [Oceanobacillus bengalensis]|uniref:amyloid fiber anchoring/assembly protein TapA n=1 Tax=Oceanobacillus bengalensis TaxID=1435466 RepID=UPI0016008EC7|nr:amyloid fiber anchoring/assembly protein TapA [Oceanobacillus bengalensis]